MVIVWNLAHQSLFARGYTSHSRVETEGRVDCEVTFGKESSLICCMGNGGTRGLPWMNRGLIEFRMEKRPYRAKRTACGGVARCAGVAVASGALWEG